MWLGHSLSFWLAVAGAMVVKILTSKGLTWRQVATIAATAVFFAWAFTGVTLAYLNLAPETWETPVAAVWALTGEGLARSILSIRSLDDMIKLWNAIRGNKSG